VKRKLLIVELWGLGDLTFATTFIRQAIASYEVHLLAKPHAIDLLQSAFPAVHFIKFNAPWTAFTKKYELWKWPWYELASLVQELRRQKFDAAISVRRDPRDHLLMRLAGARLRIGFPRRYTSALLTHRVSPAISPRHRIDDWCELGAQLGFEAQAIPQLIPEAGTVKKRNKFSEAPPIVVLHVGARIGVRRWPEQYFAVLMRKMREEFAFQLVLVPDPDGYGRNLATLADSIRSDLTIQELVALLAEATLVVCNDSGPMHIAAAVDTPTIAFFGPTDSRVFGPWGAHHKVIERDLCRYRPCFDYCRFPEPYCLTRLDPNEVWPEIREHVRKLISLEVLPRAFCRESPANIS
jgi:heptosyltransferase I